MTISSRIGIGYDVTNSVSLSVVVTGIGSVFGISRKPELRNWYQKRKSCISASLFKKTNKMKKKQIG